MPEEATPQDWEDFWYSPEKFGTWHPEDTKDGDDIVVNMDGGVGGSWQVKQETQTSLLKKKAEHFAGNYQVHCMHVILILSRKTRNWTNPPRHTLTVCSKVV